jgi:hypothetical protein
MFNIFKFIDTLLKCNTLEIKLKWKAYTFVNDSVFFSKFLQVKQPPYVVVIAVDPLWVAPLKREFTVAKNDSFFTVDMMNNLLQMRKYFTSIIWKASCGGTPFA